MSNKKCAITCEEAYLEYSSGLSLSEISIKYGCSSATVKNRLEQIQVSRRTVSQSLRGRKIYWAAKISASNLGRKLTLETRNKISISRKGTVPYNKGKRKATHPDEIKYGLAGENHWAWKGGISGDNTRFRQTSEYKVWRESVFIRDNWTCQKCGKRGGSLEADHIKSFAKYPSLRLDTSNGRTLCQTPCHREETRRQRNEH